MNRITAIRLSFCCLALLAGCKPREAAEQTSAKPIHGELIDQPDREKAVTAPADTNSMAAASRNAAPTPHPAPAAQISAPVKAAISNQENPCLSVGFDKLASYNFEVEDAPLTNSPGAPDKANDQIPARVKAFDAKKVSIKGFMLPLKVDGGFVTEFLIMKDQSLCCFGTTPKITDWVSVKVGGNGVKPVMDVPVSVEGTLHVGAIRENGYLVGIYRMDGDKLITPSEN